MKPPLALPDALVKGNTAFALDLFRVLGRESGNLFFSPYSISTALAMTFAGARGNTAAQMVRVLHFDSGLDLDDAAMHSAFAALTLALTHSQGKSQLYIANSLWPDLDCQLLQTFLAVIRAHYNNALTSVDYGDPDAACRQINRWVAGATADKIQDLLTPDMLDALTRIVLVNAIYFKGAWRNPFDPEATHQRPFQRANGAAVKVPMMAQRVTCGYAELADLQLLELPYAGEQLSMVVILPKQKTIAQAGDNGRAEATFSAADLHVWLDQLAPCEVEVYLPRFRLTQRFILNQVLQGLGMEDAFGAAANFSGMNGLRDLFISLVVHQAFVNVNEEGAEAAAATAVIMTRGLPPPAPIFCADHPFVFLIRQRSTGAILFLGRVADPSSDRRPTP